MTVVVVVSCLVAFDGAEDYNVFWGFIGCVKAGWPRYWKYLFLAPLSSFLPSFWSLVDYYHHSLR